jgi:hypothetical protein
MTTWDVSYLWADALLVALLLLRLGRYRTLLLRTRRQLREQGAEFRARLTQLEKRKAKHEPVS